MATGTLTNTLLDPSGTALSGVTVSARLKPGPTGFRAGSFSEISQLETTTTDVTGAWSLSLEINTDIEPGDSYWEIVEDIPAASGPPTLWAVQVASGSHTLYASLVSTPPSVSVPSYLTQSSGDARYLTITGGVGAGLIQAVGTATATGTATSAASANHVHVLAPGIVVNSNVAVGYLLAGVNTATATVGVSPGQIVYNSASAALFLFDGTSRMCVTPQSSSIEGASTTTTTAYVTLGAGPSVTLLTGTKASVQISAAAYNSGVSGGNLIGVAVSGASSISAGVAPATFVTDTNVVQVRSLGRMATMTGLTPGLNTFTLQCAVLSGTGTFQNRSITAAGVPG